MKHLLYVLLDGLGDLPVKSLGDRTPLEAADHPNMDSLARKGISGIVYTVGRGIAPESDVAVISMLGYDPAKTYTGRGPIEVFGSGMVMDNGDLAVRCNFATVDDNMNIIDRRVGRSLSTGEARVLAETINQTVTLESHPATFEFRSTVGHRAVLLIKSEEGPLSGNITNTDPAYQRMEGLGIASANFVNKVMRCEPLDSSEEARRAAELLEEFTRKSHEVLKDHPVNLIRRREGKPPANVVLSRDAGSRLPDFQHIKDKYGREFASMVEMPVERGIALLCGMDLVELPPPTGDQAWDYKKRAELASELVEAYGAVYVHIKGPDEPAHDGNCEGKKRAIEMIDKHFFGNLDLDLSENVVAVTSDHATPCSLKAHSGDPVPLIVSGGNIKNDGTDAFGESRCAKGSLGVMIGQEVLAKIFSLMA
ncbi:MAG: alkaline phosphatase family protein [Candidatus Methanomethylicia archaeon]|jgi:2,3-bisphosphoglycerate-independent phosphoglycerate mutase|nr:alkaline phosphatase family protein [Candidatus Methanomethylicia archaeon]